MKIPVTCARCGKRYEVDGAHAGKKGKCASCGERMMIPGHDQSAAPIAAESDAYELKETETSDVASSYISAKGSEVSEEPRPRQELKRKRAATSRGKRGGTAASGPASSKRLALFIMAGAVVVLAIIAGLAPAARMNVGRVIALGGLVLVVYGYGSGAYIAFTEDDLYGWLYLIFPFYAAYYYVSRWDEMKSRLMMVILGLALLAGGGKVLESEQPPVAAEPGAPA